MTTETLRPNATTIPAGAWSAVGAATIHAALADGTIAAPNDSTYASDTTTFVAFRCGLGDLASMPADATITSVQIVARVRKDAGCRILAATYLAGDGGSADVMDPASSGTVQTFNGAKRTVQPNGLAWTRDAINALEVQFTAQTTSSATASLRVTTVEVVVEYVAAPTVTIVEPVGLQTIARPTLGEQFVHDSLPQDRVEWRITTLVQAVAPGFNPSAFAAWIYQADDSGPGAEHVVGSDLTSNWYVIYARAACLTSTGLVWSAWASLGMIVSFDGPSPPQVVAIGEPSSGRARLDILDAGNLLTQMAADLEAGLTTFGWGNAGNAALSLSATAAHGSNSLDVISTGAGDATVQATEFSRVVPGDVIGVSAQVRAVTTARAIHFAVEWFNASGSSLGAPAFSQVLANDATASWQFAILATATVPAGAAFAKPLLRVKSTASGEHHLFDEIKLGRVALAGWDRGGLALPNLLDALTSTLETAFGAVADVWQPVADCTVAGGTPTHGGLTALELTATGASTNPKARTIRRFPVVAGADYTFLAWRRAATTGRQVALGIQWEDDAGTLLAEVADTPTADTTTYAADSFTATAPTGATYARGVLSVFGTGASEKHLFDDMSFGEDPSTAVALTAPLLPVEKSLVVEFTDTPADPASWAPLPYVGEARLDYTGRVTVYDYSVLGGPARTYRATLRAIEDGNPLASTPGESDPLTVAATSWTLIDVAAGYAFTNLWVTGPLDETLPERSATFVPLPTGADDPIRARVVTGGLSGVEASYTFHCRDDFTYALLAPLLASTKPLLFVSPLGWRRWIRILGNRQIHTRGTGERRRDITVDTVEVDPPT